jgi:hypothetical protein
MQIKAIAASDFGRGAALTRWLPRDRHLIRIKIVRRATA